MREMGWWWVSWSKTAWQAREGSVSLMARVMNTTSWMISILGIGQGSRLARTTLSSSPGHHSCFLSRQQRKGSSADNRAIRSPGPAHPTAASGRPRRTVQHKTSLDFPCSELLLQHTVSHMPASTSSLLETLEQLGRTQWPRIFHEIRTFNYDTCSELKKQSSIFSGFYA